MSGFPAAPDQDRLLERFGERYKWLCLLVVALGTVAAVLSTTSFNVAIPALVARFGLGQERVQWAITGFMGAMTLTMLPTPWLLERIGFRRCFLSGIVVLALASIAGSLAGNFSFLVGARIIQGCAAGMLQPLGTVAVMRLFPASRQGRATGLLGFGIVLAPAVAPALGGMLLDHFGWQAIFLINMPFCLVAGVAGLYLLPAAGEGKRTAFDWLGVGLLALATLSTVEGVASLHHSGISDGWTWLQFGLAIIAFGLFVWHARRASYSIVHLGLFADRPFAMGVLVSFAYGFGLYASTYLIPVFLQNVLGLSATRAGFALLPAGLALAVFIAIAGRLADRYSPQWLTIGGLLIFGFSFLLLALVNGQISYGELIGVTVLGRIGLALILPSLSLAALRGLEIQQLGQSSMVISYVRQLGGVLGIAMSAVFIEWRAAAYGANAASISRAFAESFMMVALIFVVALLAACRMKRQPAA